MSNIPENENLNMPKQENTESLADDGLSTVFSDPAEHRKTAEGVKNKKRLPVVIASLLAVAVLVGGTVAVIKLIPEKEDETSSTPAIEDITVLEGSSDDFKALTVKNSQGTFKLYSETVVTETESSDDSSDSSDSTSSTETTETVTWYLDGYDKEKIDSSSIASVVSSAVSFTASREVTEKTAADCGLDSPSVTVDVEPKEGDGYTILIGDESPDKSGYYLKLSSGDSIYVVGSDVLENLEFAALDFANSDALPALTVTDDMSDYLDDSDALASFDKLTVSGTNFPESVVIEMNTDDALSEYATYMVTSPTRRIAENIDSVFSLFQSGLTASGAYSFDTSAKSLAAVGLDKPDITVKLEVGKTSMTYKFKLQSDGNYAVVCDGVKIIKKVAASNVSFADYTTSDFYSTWVALVSIDDLSGFSFKTADKTYEFGIAANEDEESEDSYIITYNGEEIVCEDFQSFYQECISLSCTDFTVSKASGEPEYVMTFKYKEGGDYTVKFVKVSETRYQYSIDGVETGKVNAAALKKLAKSVEELVS